MLLAGGLCESRYYFSLLLFRECRRGASCFDEVTFRSRFFSKSGLQCVVRSYQVWQQPAKHMQCMV